MKDGTSFNKSNKVQPSEIQSSQVVTRKSLFNDHCFDISSCSQPKTRRKSLVPTSLNYSKILHNLQRLQIQLVADNLCELVKNNREYQSNLCRLLWLFRLFS